MFCQDAGEIDPDSGEMHAPKNIRRRVYDALNVLMAMSIIAKEKKEIRFADVGVLVLVGAFGCC